MLVADLNEQARIPQISVPEMRRVSSYGGPSGVAGSERLKLRLSSTPGLHLLSNNSLEEAGFLAAASDQQDERVFHRTYGAARNFYAIASNLKQVAKRESWATRKDPVGLVVKERIVFDEPVHADEHCNDVAPAVVVEEVDGNHSSDPGLNGNRTREGDLGAVFEVPSNDSQLVEEVESKKSITTSSSADNLVGLSDSKGCESSQLGTHPVAGELQAEGPDLEIEPEPPSIALAEVNGSSSTSPIHAARDAQIFPAGKCEAETADVVDNFSNEKSQELETGAGLQDSENGRSKDIAAIEIQSCWRGWRERQHFKQVVYRVIFLQSLVRRNQESKQYHGILHAAVVLQKYWRVVQSVQVLKRLKLEQAFRGKQRRINNAAIVVQKHWRSVRSRRLLNNVRKEREVRAQQRNQAAVVLQKHWRAQRGMRLVKHLKMQQVAREQQRMEDAAVVLQKHWRARRGRFLVKHHRMEQVVKERQRIDSAATVLQKYWRAQQGRRVVKQLRIKQVAMEKQRMDVAAVILQKNWRAHQGRSLVKHQRMEQVLREQQRINNATIVLQKFWRAQQGRRLVELLKLELCAREQLRIDNATVVLQKRWPAKQCRCLVRNLKPEELAREQLIQNNAASVLQKHWRAKQDRCLVKHLRMEQVAREQLIVDNAAIVLQKYWRAQRGRCLVKHLGTEQVAKEKENPNDAATVVQKHWRAKQGRSYVNHLKLEQMAREQRFNRAAIVIQKHWQAKQGKCSVKRFKMEQAVMEKQRIDHAAIVLQKHWRGGCGRSLVNHRKLELGVKELERIDHAAIVVQKLWRARQSRGLVEQLLRQRKRDDATVVLQKHWRSFQSRCLVKDMKKRQLVDNAVLVVQKYWRLKQSMSTVKHLKMELAAREKHRTSAATILQKHWRARQSILALKLLKMEAAVREHQRLDIAATIFQMHWRGRHSRLLVKHLRTEQASRELGGDVNAALVLQKYWRGFQSRKLLKFLYMEQAAKVRAALCIQARVRGNATRVKLKAALAIQKAFQVYWSRLPLSAVSIQHALSSSIDEKLKIQAIIVLLACAHGFAGRRRLTQSANLSLQPNDTSSKTFTKTGVATDTSPRSMMTGSFLYASDVAKYLSKAEDSLESSSSSIVHHVDGGAKSVDRKYRSLERMQNLESSPINLLKHRWGLGHGLDSEFSATSVGDVLVQKQGVQEDWNDVAVDQLEECLDTCLAALRPLPSGSQYCLPGLDLPGESKQCVATDQNVENMKDVDRISSTELSSSTIEVAQLGPRTGSNIDEPDRQPNDLIAQSDLAGSQATPIDGTDHLDISSGPLQEAGTQQMENPVQGRRLGTQTLKQNEQRLKQFAQVFLLQRHIALQQQCAQAAPPFPPSLSSGSEIPRQMVNHPLEVDSLDQGEVAVQSPSLHTDTQLSEVDRGRPKEHHVVCEIFDPDDEQTVSRKSQAIQNSGAKQVLERPRPDVVLDMVLLLRRIEAEYGTSEADFEGETSTWCTTGCGDVEEGIPLLDRNLGSMRRESSVAKFANAVNMKHMSIPDMNAVLLVFIAMVVYTRTVCKGLFFGARQTHRRP